jgi:hypothetical protein
VDGVVGGAVDTFAERVQLGVGQWAPCEQDVVGWRGGEVNGHE